MKKNNTVKLVESSLMLATATVFSLITIIKLPFGGGISFFSMVPILIIAYRYGTSWSLLVAFTFSLIQTLLGFQNIFPYVTGPSAQFAIVALDYVVAFSVLGLGGVFRKKGRTQSTSFILGVLLTCTLRYICHVVAGCTIWIGLSIPDKQALFYSLIYNASYMIPETLLTLVALVYLSKILDFGSGDITRAPKERELVPAAFVLSLTAKLSLVCAFIYAVQAVFSALFSEEKFDIKNIKNADWFSFCAVTLIAVALFFILSYLSKHINKKRASKH